MVPVQALRHVLWLGTEAHSLGVRGGGCAKVQAGPVESWEMEKDQGQAEVHHLLQIGRAGVGCKEVGEGWS